MHACTPAAANPLLPEQNREFSPRWPSCSMTEGTSSKSPTLVWNCMTLGMQVAEQREAQLLAKAAVRQAATQAQHQAVLLRAQEEHQRQQVGQSSGRSADVL